MITEALFKAGDYVRRNDEILKIHRLREYWGPDYVYSSLNQQKPPGALPVFLFEDAQDIEFICLPYDPQPLCYAQSEENPAQTYFFETFYEAWEFFTEVSPPRRWLFGVKEEK